MPMPSWWGHINKHIFNPRAMKPDTKWTLITHVGRNSGKTYTTPIGAFPVNGGFAVYVIYGRNTDWVQNVLASNSGTLESDGETYEIRSARLVPREEIESEIPEDVARPPALLRVKDVLRMDVAEG